LKSFYETLKNHIESYPLNYGDSDIQSILEMLWNTYCQHNQLDTEQIKAGFANLYRHMKHLPLSDVDGVIDIVCSLCWEHEKAGFVEGVRVGIRLEQELTD
jgi:hypothetical protein